MSIPTIEDEDRVISADFNDAATISTLIEKVSVGAFERERDEVAPFEAIELVRDARLGAFRLRAPWGLRRVTA